MNSAKEASAARQLDNAQRLLAVLEEQASGFTVLTIPAPLKVDLDNQRAKVAYLAERVGRSGSDGTRPPQPKRLPPNWSGQQSLQEVLDYLSLFCPDELVQAVVKQVILAPSYRSFSHWTIALQRSTKGRGREAISASMAYEYEQVIPEHVSNPTVRSYAVYHNPISLSPRGRLVSLSIAPSDGSTTTIQGNELERYADRGAYGTFYRVPYTLHRGRSAVVSARADAFHPMKSEEILVTYQPCIEFSLTVILPTLEADRFRLRVEYWHPSRQMEWMADEVNATEGYQQSVYRIREPLLPFQGIRVAWHYR